MRVLIAVALLMCGAAVLAQDKAVAPDPQWQDMGVLHLYNASCPKGYDYQPFQGAVYLEAQPEDYEPQITATEYPARGPAGTCSKEQR